jgi:hypothetical protein
MSYHLPCNVLKCGDITPKEDKEYDTLKKMMTQSPDQFKNKISVIAQSQTGYYNVVHYIQKNPTYHDCLLKIAILFKMYDIVAWFCDKKLLSKAARLYSVQFLSMAMPDRQILTKLLNYGFTTFLKPLDFSKFTVRHVSPLLHSLAYINYDFVHFITQYPCVMPNIHIILADTNAHDIYTKSMFPIENIVLFINKDKKKLLKATMYENKKRQEFFGSLPYIVHNNGVAKIRHQISFNHTLFKKLLKILHLLISKGSSVGFCKITDIPTQDRVHILNHYLLPNVVYKTLATRNNSGDLQFLEKTFPFAFSPRSLQHECSNAIKTFIMTRSGVCDFPAKVKTLPLTQIMKDFIIS